MLGMEVHIMSFVMEKRTRRFGWNLLSGTTEAEWMMQWWKIAQADPATNVIANGPMRNHLGESFDACLWARHNDLGSTSGSNSDDMVDDWRLRWSAIEAKTMWWLVYSLTQPCNSLSGTRVCPVFLMVPEGSHAVGGKIQLHGKYDALRLSLRT